MAALTTGVTAPEFTLPTTEGKQFSLAEALKRGPVVVAFFKVSCPVCQYAFPFLERIHKAYKGHNATIVGVSQNSLNDTLAFMKQFGISFPVTLDDPANYKVSNAYGLTNVPTVFYIEPDGEITVSSVGWVRADITDINSRLAAALNRKRPALFQPNEYVEDWKAG
ncbi:MAG: peroxiredoxin family protein [Terriglobales bacterium]